MPILKSAKKKLRKDVRRAKRNKEYLTKIQTALKAIKKNNDDDKRKELTKKAYSIIDKAAKKKVIEKNKAARLKSKATKSAFVKKVGPKKK
jgi:small subunit ribosomal protein S20